MCTVLLIRHGNTMLPDRIPGRMPGVHLSDDGRRQAEALVRSLQSVPIGAIVTSPLDRAIETAGPLSRSSGVAVVTDERLVEIDFGSWTGKYFDELEADQSWKYFHSYRNGTIIPGGELMVQVQSRMVRAVEDVAGRYPDSTIVVISHNDPIKSLIAWYLGISLDMFLRVIIDTCSISILTFSATCTGVVAVNLPGACAVAPYLNGE